MKVKSESEVAQLCPTLRDPMDCSLPGSSVYGIFQARVLEQGAVRPWLASPQMVGSGGEHWLQVPQFTLRGDALPWIVDLSLMHLVKEDV